MNHLAKWNSENLPWFRRIRPRFSLRSLLLLMAIACLILAFLAQPLLEQQRLQADLSKLTGLGARISVVARGREHPAGSNYVSRLLGIGTRQGVRFRVDFSGTNITDEDVRSLSEMKPVRIRSLNLSNTNITDGAMKHIASLRDLREVDLRHTRITDEGFAKLRRCKLLLNVQVFGTGVSYDALAALEKAQPTEVYFCQTKALAELEKLGVECGGVPILNNVEVGLDIGGGGGIGRGLAALRVFADGARFTATDFAHLSWCKELESLGLCDCQIPAGGISRLRTLANLRTLRLLHCDLREGQARELKDFTQLKDVALMYCSVPKEDVAFLRDSLPNCAVKAEGREWEWRDSIDAVLSQMRRQMNQARYSARH